MTAVVEQLFPPGPPADVGDLDLGGPLRPFEPQAVAFLIEFSRRMLRDTEARRFPELVALAYFLRRSELERLGRRHAEPFTARLRRYPRGVVFHVPPANVDTMFVYSWALSLLAGNSNVVRLSARAGRAAEVIVRLLGEVLASGEYSSVGSTQRIVRYGHDDDATAELSAMCDLRVIWGGDATVTALRRHPLRASARDLGFPDRNSFAVVKVSAYRALDPGQRDRVAERLFNDVFWFDQAGCASPRWLIWCGGAADDPPSLGADLAERLRLVTDRKGFRVVSGMAIEKMVGTYGEAIEGHVDRIDKWSNEVFTVHAADVRALPRRYLGAGVLVESVVERLVDIAPLVQRSDQTVAHLGFTVEELTQLADACNGRGVDRLVPVGQALAFSAVWDGFDLLTEFSRLVELCGSTELPDGVPDRDEEV